jgi:hypothetical protein
MAQVDRAKLAWLDVRGDVNPRARLREDMAFMRYQREVATRDQALLPLATDIIESGNIYLSQLASFCESQRVDFDIEALYVGAYNRLVIGLDELPAIAAVLDDSVESAELRILARQLAIETPDLMQTLRHAIDNKMKAVLAGKVAGGDAD